MYFPLRFKRLTVKKETLSIVIRVVMPRDLQVVIDIYFLIPGLNLLLNGVTIQKTTIDKSTSVRISNLRQFSTFHLYVEFYLRTNGLLSRGTTSTQLPQTA
jgi:hypothetical protein